MIIVCIIQTMEQQKCSTDPAGSGAKIRSQIMIKINTANLIDERAPLYHRYQGQTNPQDAYVQLLDNGQVYADWSSEIGNGMPFSAWHGTVLRWSISPYVNGSELICLLESDEVMALLKRVHAGHTVHWDGHNHVGQLDDDAAEASERLEAIFGEFGEWGTESVDVWDAYEWIDAGFNVPDLLEAGRIEDYAETFEPEDSDNVQIDGDLCDAVAEMAAGKLEHPDPRNPISQDDEIAIAKMLADYDADKYGHLLAELTEAEDQ